MGNNRTKTPEQQLVTIDPTNRKQTFLKRLRAALLGFRALYRNPEVLYDLKYRLPSGFQHNDRVIARDRDQPLTRGRIVGISFILEEFEGGLGEGSKLIYTVEDAHGNRRQFASQNVRPAPSKITYLQTRRNHERRQRITSNQD